MFLNLRKRNDFKVVFSLKVGLWPLPEENNFWEVYDLRCHLSKGKTFCQTIKSEKEGGEVVRIIYPLYNRCASTASYGPTVLPITVMALMNVLSQTLPSTFLNKHEDTEDHCENINTLTSQTLFLPSINVRIDLIESQVGNGFNAILMGIFIIQFCPFIYL